jgi:hypothetical protein
MNHYSAFNASFTAEDTSPSLLDSGHGNQSNNSYGAAHPPQQYNHAPFGNGHGAPS